MQDGTFVQDSVFLVMIMAADNVCVFSSSLYASLSSILFLAFSFGFLFLAFSFWLSLFDFLFLAFSSAWTENQAVVPAPHVPLWRGDIPGRGRGRAVQEEHTHGAQAQEGLRLDGEDPDDDRVPQHRQGAQALQQRHVALCRHGRGEEPPAGPAPPQEEAVCLEAEGRQGQGGVGDEAARGGQGAARGGGGDEQR